MSDKKSKGKCLCGNVEFEVSGKLSSIYKCHCSLCRKATGTSSNAASIVDKDRVTWIKGRNVITEFEQSSGFRSSFCSKCGAPVPNIIKATDKYWIPVGLLEETGDFKVAAELFVDSKVGWSQSSNEALKYSEMPDLESLCEVLK